jgi:uncharacterized membrane protein
MSQYLHEERLKKVLAWRACSVSITLISTWVYTGSVKEACFFTMVLHAVLILSHYIFETLWDKFYN